jgi:hypothetical protein
MKRMRVMVWIAVLLFCITVPLVGADARDSGDGEGPPKKSEWDYSDLGKSEFGSVLHGPDFTKDQLKGKVVLVVFFGTRSGDTNALKDIAKLVAKYHKSGFAAIGVRLWVKRGNGKDIASMAEDMKITSIPIVNYATTDAEGKKRKGVKNTTGRFYCPYGVLYGRDGSIVWERRYAGAQKEVTRLIKRELKKKGLKTKKTNKFEDILDGGEFPNSTTIVKQIKAGRLGVAYRRCEKYSDSEGDVGTEASELKELLEKYHKRQFELFQDQKIDAPTEAIETLGDISKAFRGTDFSKKAQKTLAELKKDKDFQILLKSYKEYERIVGMIEKIPAPPADDSSHKRWKRKYKTRITGLSRKIEIFRKKYPDSPFIQKLDDAMVPLDTDI